MSVLELLKQSSTGLTRIQMVKKCANCGIGHWLSETKKLVDSGLAFIDKYPRPARIKPTNRVW